MQPQRKLTHEEVKQQMLDYLEQKYDKEFVDFAVEYRGFDRDDDLLFAYPADADVREWAYGTPWYYFRTWRTGDPYNPEFEDGYVGYVMWPRVREEVTAIVRKHFPESVVGLLNMGDSAYPAELRPDMPYEEFEAYLKSEHYISVEVGISRPEGGTIDSVSEPYAALKAELAERFGHGWLVLQAFDPDKYTSFLLPHEDVERGFSLPSTYSDILKAEDFDK
jgi:hypothetical protein